MWAWTTCWPFLPNTASLRCAERLDRQTPGTPASPACGGSPERGEKQIAELRQRRCLCEAFALFFPRDLCAYIPKPHPPRSSQARSARRLTRRSPGGLLPLCPAPVDLPAAQEPLHLLELAKRRRRGAGAGAGGGAHMPALPLAHQPANQQHDTATAEVDVVWRASLLCVWSGLRRAPHFRIRQKVSVLLPTRVAPRTSTSCPRTRHRSVSACS